MDSQLALMILICFLGYAVGFISGHALAFRPNKYALEKKIKHMEERISELTEYLDYTKLGVEEWKKVALNVSDQKGQP